MSNDPKNSIKQFLKKKIDIPEKPAQSTEEFIKKKLIEEPRDYYDAQKSFWNRLRSRITAYPSKLFFFRRGPFKKFMNETFPLVAFITFSCYMVYSMEYKYTKMKDKVIASKSLKQIQIEEEDEVLKNDKK